MTDNILATAQARIRQRMNETADSLCGGNCLSAESAAMVGAQYAKQVGVIEGLALAERDILDVIEEAEKREQSDT
ncbi:MAG: hypothetical protein H8E94_09505 [Alphaproteobacteria bacterium]|nr:hypothetical protein [Alphaproteobacteria bacterium]